MKRTPWFGRETPPVRCGWYEARGRFWETPEGGIVRRFWDGRRWMWTNMSGQLASATLLPHHRWRGIVGPAT